MEVFRGARFDAVRPRPDVRTLRNEHRNVAVQVRQAAVQSRQLPVAAACELSKVGIGHLSVTDYSP